MSKGIILAGGVATRLFPATEAVSKQALPIYDKPMIYYPLTTLMEAGVREIMVITNPENLRLYRRIFIPAENWGIKVSVVQQDSPRGIAQAITIASGHAFIENGQRFFLALGDNLFHGAGLGQQLRQASQLPSGAGIFLASVRDPERYGVAEFSADNKLSRIVEKPVSPPSSWAVTGIYSYDELAPELVRKLQPSSRRELEITDLNNAYLDAGSLHVFKLDKTTAWLDTGTPDALLSAAQYVQAVQQRSMTLVGSPDLAALRNGWMSVDDVRRRFELRQDLYAQSIMAILN